MMFAQAVGRLFLGHLCLAHGAARAWPIHNSLEMCQRKNRRCPGGFQGLPGPRLPACHGNICTDFFSPGASHVAERRGLGSMWAPPTCGLLCQNVLSGQRGSPCYMDA